MRFIKFAVLLSIGVLAAVCRPAAAAEKPNILFIFADDLAFDCVGAHGNKEVQTPNIDRLAKQGVTFTHAYNMGAWNGAVCVASRTMLNTGQFVWRAFQSSKALKKTFVPQKQMWSQLLHEAGYDTYMTGKWHVSASAEEIFQTTAHIRPGMPKQTPEGYNRPLGPDDKTWQPWDKKFGGFWEGGRHWSEIVADDAEDFLQTASTASNPFFMYIAFNASHDPRQSPKEFVDRYPLKNISLPKPFLPEYPYEVGSNHIRDEKLAPFPRTEYAVKVHRQEYYAIITHMDVQIGRILQALEKSGKADNTYIFFTADHGLAVGHHGFMGKQNMFDHSVRVPFIVTGPDVAHNERHDARIYLQDVMPSTLELAGAEKPKHVEFQSVLPLLRGEKKCSYDSIYNGYIDFQRMITDGDYKLIVYPKIARKLLYNLKDDPLELTDLAEQPQYAKLIGELTAKLQKLQTELGDEVTIE